MYQISKTNLDDLIKNSSKVLVGEVMRRFEVIDDKEVIKKITKELIYENFRNLKSLIIALNSGMDFVTNPKDRVYL